MLTKVIKFLTIALAVIWLFMMAINNGITAVVFPISIILFGGRLYVWDHNAIDLTTSILLLELSVLSLSGIAISPWSRRPKSDNTSVVISEIHSKTFTRWWSFFRTPKLHSIKIEGRRLHKAITPIAIVAILLFASILSRVYEKQYFSSMIINSAVVISKSGQITSSLAAITPLVPSLYNPKASELYYFTSGWEAEIGNYTLAKKYDVLLCRAGAALENPNFVAVGLYQYRTIQRAPLPNSIAIQLIRSTRSPQWRRTIEALLNWQRYGVKSELYTDLTALLKTAKRGRRQQIQLSITYISSK